MYRLKEWKANSLEILKIQFLQEVDMITWRNNLDIKEENHYQQLDGQQE